MRVRAARAGDLPQRLRLWPDLLAYHRGLGETDIRVGPATITEGRRFFVDHLDKRDRLCLVAVLGGSPVGFLVATVRAQSPAFGGFRYGHIYDAHVAGVHRRVGVGTALVKEAFRWFRRRRVHRVQLQVRAQNARGIDFWRSFRFEELALVRERTL